MNHRLKLLSMKRQRMESKRWSRVEMGGKALEVHKPIKVSRKGCLSVKLIDTRVSSETS